ncbi:MAG: hypothetical protein GX162_01645 [Firmicutes bacterium]|nr:hypothetical protein [Bacillota bacterium]
MELPDVIGWELSRAREECRALDISVSVQITQPPGNDGVLYSEEEEEGIDTLRVVGVRPTGQDAVLLIVAPEVW